MKKITFIILACTCSMFSTISCKKAEPVSPKFDSAAAKTAIESSYREFETAFNAKDSVAIAKCYTTDAKLMQPNAKSAEGTASIQKTYGQWFKGEAPKIACKLMDVWGNENTLIAEDDWTETDKDGKVVDMGKSIEVYKMEDGKWKLYRDCFNSDMPAKK